MKLRSILSTLICFVSFAVFAQGVSLFGDENQPGNRLHAQVVALMDSGNNQQSAIEQAISEALGETATVVDAESKSAIAFDIPHAAEFYNEMMAANSLIEVTKVLSEAFPDKAVHTITLGVVLYPDFAQEVFDGAALAGVMSPEDILVAVIQAGADPTTVSDATAAGPAAGPDAPITPLGTGVGAGGTGGGDTTASTN